MTMPKKDKFTFMEEEWGFAQAPIHADAIQRFGDPFSRAACAKEAEQFEKKFLLGGIKGGLTYGYLWSLPNPQLPLEATGTGYGKTSLMKDTERRINADFGEQVLNSVGLKQPQRVVSAYTCLNNEDMRGLYALLVSAIERWSDASQCPGPDGRSVMAAARAVIVERLGCDEDDEAAVRAEVEKVRRALPGGGTLPPLREEILGAFCSPDPERLTEELGQLSAAMKTRNGLALFEAAFAALAAAGIEHVFLFLDQLEYLVTNKAVTKAKKSSEIARFRTVFTQHAGLGNRCHVVFTLHDRASRELETFWDINRLPPFDPRGRDNQNMVVVLRGLETPERIADLVTPYFNQVRPKDHPDYDSADPLDPAIFKRLWESSTARPGIILRRVAAALDLAAEENRKVIDAGMLTRVLDVPLGRSESYAEDDDASSLVG
jgi:hypothetical protein